MQKFSVFCLTLWRLSWHWLLLIVIASLLLVYLGINIVLKGWDELVWTSFVAGTFTNLSIVGCIGFLRYAWEATERIRQEEKRLAKMNEQFIANVSHELRSPLSRAIGCLDIIRDRGRKMNEEEHNIFLTYAIYSCSELQRIADNILDAMRSDSDVSPPWIKEFDVGSVAFDVLRHIDAHDHFIHVDIPEGIVAQGDSQQVRQVMRNLLSNCFKYSPKGSPVTVRIWRDDSFAYVCVSDKGPGIGTDQIPRMFQRFSRLECDVAGPVRGIGLGLYICRRFIENMGGRIWVESIGVPGEGSSFYFTLPCTSGLSLPMHRK